MFFLHLYVYRVHVWCLRMSEKVVTSLEATVSDGCAKNQTQGSCKGNWCSFFSFFFSFSFFETVSLHNSPSYPKLTA